VRSPGTHAGTTEEGAQARPARTGRSGPGNGLDLLELDKLKGRETSMASEEQDIRRRAIKRLEAKRDFFGHAAAYVAVNALLIAIWS
jgi:hypothetical protein